ncbi:LysR family transcriptional regulator [Lichenifustis flavocetrariae]|uniref:LysR family transcriptional regulator n=1 Tax=Lichenifustis flavocetrariae TaxID=2949735 RepID=A0AA41Z1M8_9HYPH|nr:LysR family transcriptional regulator [Lichenifustis flavocetrariae]MCW6512069.1 LysR family transcriptional regulator [Lichenifustis flavocetrariae]
MMDLVDLRAFVRIVELRSVSAAARALDAPKSSISRSLARLEAAVGAVLVERSTRHLRLTDAGALLHPHALRILNDVDEAGNALGSFAGKPRGTLRVNAPFTFAVGLLAPMLPGFRARYPDVRVVLSIDNRTIDVLAEDVDLVVRIGTLAESGLISRRLATMQLWTCASPAYLAARGVPASVDDLSGHDLLDRADKATRWCFHTGEGKEAAVEFQPVMVVPEPAAMLVVLVGGGGIARLPDFLAAPAVARSELVRVLPTLEPESVDVHALYPSHRSLSAKVRVFIDALVVHLKANTAADRPGSDPPRSNRSI